MWADASLHILTLPAFRSFIALIHKSNNLVSFRICPLAYDFKDYCHIFPKWLHVTWGDEGFNSATQLGFSDSNCRPCLDGSGLYKADATMPWLAIKKSTVCIELLITYAEHWPIISLEVVGYKLICQIIWHTGIFGTIMAHVHAVAVWTWNRNI